MVLNYEGSDEILYTLTVEFCYLITASVHNRVV